MGPSEQNIAKQAYRSGEPLPDRIENAPELIQGLSLYMDAFFDLDSTRQIGFELCRISWREIRDYGLTFEFDEIQMDNLLYFMPRMDLEYLKFVKSKRPKGDGSDGDTV